MDKIDEILLVGGSTRIPFVKEWLKRFSRKDHLNESLNPDEAVAIGAAKMAEILFAQGGHFDSQHPVLDSETMAEEKRKVHANIQAKIEKVKTYFVY